MKLSNRKSEILNVQGLLSTKGWCVFDSVVDPELVEVMKEDLYDAYDRCRDIQRCNGVWVNTENTLHHLVGFENSYMEFLEKNYLFDIFEHYFNGPFILNSFGGAINQANSKSYAHNIHRDIRSYSGNINLLLNTLVMLDDFTEDNGATLLLSGSHEKEGKPDEKYFKEHAEKAIGKAGSILVFNSNVWHSGGINHTNRARCSVTPMYSKPFMKQQLDYPRWLGYEKKDEFTSKMQQVLGFNARVPSNLDEWYQPKNRRFYLPDQG